MNVMVSSLLRFNWPAATGIMFVHNRLFPPANLIMAVLSTKNLMLLSLTTPQIKGIMASTQGLTFLSGVAAFAALSFFTPIQNPAVEPYVHCSDDIPDSDLSPSVGLEGFITLL